MAKRKKMKHYIDNKKFEETIFNYLEDKDKYEEDLMEYGKWLDKNYESVFHFGLFTKMVNKEWSKKDILRVLNSFKDKL